jgi:transcriptional regulator with XRE-family HTH domain
MSENRTKRARERAGLSLGQAAKLLGIDREMLEEVEDAPRFEGMLLDKMVDVYQVREEWITGKVPLRDYEAVKKMVICSRNGEELSFHDRDILAEFAASIPRSAKTVAERLEDVRKKNYPEKK